MQLKIPIHTLVEAIPIEAEAVRVAKLGRPATRVNEIWSVEKVRWDRSVMLAIDLFSMLPVIASPTHGTDDHIVSILERAARLSEYPAKLWVSSDRLYESRHLDEWAAQHRIQVIFRSTISQSKITKPLVERLRRDCLDYLDSPGAVEMAWALQCWRERVITRPTAVYIRRAAIK